MLIFIINSRHIFIISFPDYSHWPSPPVTRGCSKAELMDTSAYQRCVYSGFRAAYVPMRVHTMMPCGHVTQLTQIRWVSASLNARQGRVQAHRCGSDNPMMLKRTVLIAVNISAEVEHAGQRQEQQTGATYSRCFPLLQHLNRGKSSQF